MKSLGALWLVIALVGGAAARAQQADGERAPAGAPAYASAAMVTTPEADPAGWAEAGKGSPALGVLDLAPLLAQDEADRRAGGKPLRVGLMRRVPAGLLTAEHSGVWGLGLDGTATWRLRIDAPGAKAVRVHFARFDLPEGSRLVMRGTDARIAPAMYDRTGPLWTGTFLAPMEFGETVYLEYQAPAEGFRARPVIVIDEVLHVYRDPATGLAAGEEAARELACHTDVNCAAVEGVARDAVALITYSSGGSGYICSGTALVDSDANTVAAWFLTANHCLSTQAEASTLTVYWLYQTNVCNGSVPLLGNLPRTIGSTLLHTGALPALPDFTFLRLAHDLNQGQGMAGWDVSPIPENETAMFAIHHPGGSYKRLSIGRQTHAAPICGALPESVFAYFDWEQGRTEGGSSGSGLFQCGPACGPPWRLKGTLFGTCGISTGCGGQEGYNTVYGRFANAYPYLTGELTGTIPDDGYEPNDGFSQAPSLAIGDHALRLVDFEDFFQVEIASPGALSLTIEYAEPEMDLRLRLYNSSNVLLQSSNGQNGVETINRVLSVGTYIIRTTRTLGWGGDYSMRIAFGCASWSAAEPQEPPKRDRSVMAFDSARGRTVLFGGFGDGADKGDTWEWNGLNWAKRDVTGPGARREHAMAYDAARQRTVLFGGIAGSTRLGDTWEWDGTSWQQRLVGGPSARHVSAMAYDSGRQRVVLYGGYDGSDRGDTWEWDGAQWTDVSTSGPGGLNSHAMAYDAARGRLVLFGGYQSGANQSTVWERTGTTWSLAGSGGPPARRDHAMAFDSNAARVLVFGGFGSARLGDLWGWSGSSWTPLQAGPAARNSHAAAFDLQRGALVMFGGAVADGVPAGDTWEFASGAWSERANGSPAPREKAAAAFDVLRNNVVMFGGINPSGLYSPPRFADTWTWDGAVWSRRNVPGPGARYAAMMAYDGARGNTVLFGGYDGTNELNETWIWDGSTWTQLTNVNAPGARDNGAMVYDPDRQNVVMFSGFGVGNDTWTWNGSAWTFMCNCGPSAREGFAMCWDPVHHVVVLWGGFNGGTRYTDTWTWDGTTWTQVATSGPSGRTYPRMVFDAARGRVVLMGGYDGVANLNDVWTWDGSVWVKDQTSATVPGRAAHVMVYDPVRTRTFVSGGYGDAGWLADSWYLSGVPQFNSHPSARTVLLPAGFQLSASVSGASPLSLQWRRNGVPVANGGGVSGATTATLTVGTALVAQSGVYDLAATDPCGSVVYSQPATVDIWCMGDWNRDHAVTPSDVAAYINDWSAAVASGGLGPDVDGSGAVNPADVANFITNWFAQTAGPC